MYVLFGAVKVVPLVDVLEDVSVAQLHVLSIVLMVARAIAMDTAVSHVVKFARCHVRQLLQVVCRALLQVVKAVVPHAMLR